MFNSESINTSIDHAVLNVFNGTPSSDYSVEILSSHLALLGEGRRHDLIRSAVSLFTGAACLPEGICEVVVLADTVKLTNLCAPPVVTLNTCTTSYNQACLCDCYELHILEQQKDVLQGTLRLLPAWPGAFASAMPDCGKG